MRFCWKHPEVIRCPPECIMLGVCDVCLAHGWRWELWPLASGGVPRGSDGVRCVAALLGGFCEGRGWGGFVCPSVLGVFLLLQFSEFPPPGFFLEASRECLPSPFFLVFPQVVSPGLPPGVWMYFFFNY